ncbi:hypothetical protein B0T26DRAFT_769792 [Lasiosphaeria miniovina]|uniref:Bacteriophage T5 Orf172 DNA-binding domain-containing protein n=1 Tax=Lasiosphaeria miniovina TaxID=1954250 RepID=A0AA40ATV7_9PEZI|nr:uncharacterized protein B0T26DRAFT_769792 [Lasiosphaeria miniovina]KAK0721886.1 hypothetical protein B0T26DRAFT_769792 [Lasiosphaeria miniovina]
MPLISRGWFLIILSTGFVLLTCLQARGSILTRGIELVDKSRAYPVFVLRAISELAGLALAATINATWERMKWALVCRSRTNTTFLDFLTLDEGTRAMALMDLAAGRAGPSLRTRLWSLGRLLSTVVIPVTGILIMSQVEIQIAFTEEPSQPPYLGYDLQPMNASVAVEYFGFSDLVLTANPGAFLHNPARSVDLSQQGEDASLCRLNADSQGQRTGCHRSYFIAGESVFMTPDLINDASFPKAEIIYAPNRRGFLLEFDAGDSTTRFDPEKECRTYSSRYWGARAGAVRLCVGSSGPNELQARLVSCPGSIAALQQCQNDTSWYDNVDWTVKMSTYFRHASVAYSRSNGTIIWHSFTNAPAIPLNITPTETLSAYDTLLYDTSNIFAKNASTPPAAAFSSSTFAAYLWMSEPVFSGQNATNPATINGVFSNLQSLLTIPLYLCQNGIARRLLPLALGAKSVDDKSKDSSRGSGSSSPGFDDLVGLLSLLPDRTSPASFAYHRYQVAASTPTLIAYIVLSGVAVLCCAAAQLLGRSGAFHYDAAQKSQMEWLATLRVRYIYTFRLTAESKPSTPPRCWRTEGNRDAGRAAEGRTKKSTDSKDKKILLKICRATNVYRRLDEWQWQGGYNLSLIRYYPYVPSASTAPSSSSSSAVPRKIPHSHKVEATRQAVAEVEVARWWSDWSELQA